MPTTIYVGSCAKNVRKQFGIALPDNFILWPEIGGSQDDPIPLHPKEIVKDICPGLINKSVGTMCEHIILYMQREVRLHRMEAKDLEIYWCFITGKTERLKVDEEGDFLDEWPEGFFNERAELLFND